MSADTNRPFADRRFAGMTAEERQWYEGWEKLNDRFGANVPKPVDLYGNVGDASCFVVVDGCVCSVEPLYDDMAEPITFTPALAEELRKDLVMNVAERWGISAGRSRWNLT